MHNYTIISISEIYCVESINFKVYSKDFQSTQFKTLNINRHSFSSLLAHKIKSFYCICRNKFVYAKIAVSFQYITFNHFCNVFSFIIYFRSLVIERFLNIDSGDSRKILKTFMLKLENLILWHKRYQLLKLHESSVLFIYDAQYLREEREAYNSKYQTTPSMPDLVYLSATGKPDPQKVRFFLIDFEYARLSNGTRDRPYMKSLYLLKTVLEEILFRHCANIIYPVLLKFRGNSTNVWFNK